MAVEALTRRRIFSRAAFTLVGPMIVATTACVGPLQQWGEETSLVSKSPSFRPSSLGSEPVAVLNAVVGFGLEGYSQQVSRSLSIALLDMTPAIKSIPAHEALSRINREGLSRDYARAVSDYIRSGILSRTELQNIGQALGVRYVFQPSMASFSQSMSGRFSFFGLRLIQTRISMLRLSVQLWNTESGEIVWEGSGEATLAGEDVREFRIPFEQIAARLWRRILEELTYGLPADADGAHADPPAIHQP